ncbi:D-mannonate oxidoreductase [Aerococcus urinaehominis]|uniref:D-mannonate oxidoreductase n=1 Tax=Aerococcus urinaehominis TaxID=128944 RepID=A0A0X8FLW2_9LACT|nr:SDR family oxidoreductase [Aerococcus urinaehominis]AMB99037.1 D-mannonate oxidoreductase [Aerococcus urinaehominis]SDM50871.1 NAD(P)-dependent dehydrogenase, short-chain alcohol dehydrogenase family [Aerococcus urinaehominis]
MANPFVHDFTGKTVVLTGAGGVIISKIAESFAQAGANVALLDLNEEAANKVAEEINASGAAGKAAGYLCNVLELESIQAAHDAIKADFGPCDILVNGAGGNNPRATADNEFHEVDLPEDTKSFFDLDPAGVEFVFNLNFLGTLLPTQVFAKEMVGREGANIINVSSMNAFTPLTKIPAYSGAKAAISNFTQWLAVHFSHVGVRCNAIAPGFLVSNQNIDLMFEADHETLKPRGEKIIRNTPMGRFGEAEEMVGPTLFLADEKAASFVNGVVLPIDGGFSAYSGV